MSSKLREILVNFRDALANIDVQAGYSFTVQAVELGRTVTRINGRYPYIEVLWTEVEIDPKVSNVAQTSSDRYSIDIVTLCHFLYNDDDVASDPIMLYATEYCSDIIKAAQVDFRRGGLAEKTDSMGFHIEVDETPSGPAFLAVNEFRIQTLIDSNDPTLQG